MVTMQTGAEGSLPKSNPNPVIEGTPKTSSLYEKCREERIKENLQRLQNLGILNLSLKLKSQTRPVKRPYGNSNSASKSTPPLHPSRRSSRLENTTPPTYTYGVDVVRGTRTYSKRKTPLIRQGPRPEVYTEEHEKLLGHTERTWTCFVDGCGEDGKRIYDQVKGKTCHQCRQKTLGHRTHCSECEMVQGQFCGDCLYMRYGEHVLEALENPNWVCPVCRGICNCSLCRNHNGWAPTGPIYRRIAALGYKSVAHYLIQTNRSETEDTTTPNQASAKRSLSFQEAKPFSQEVPTGDSLKKEEDENTNENPDSAKKSLCFVLPSVDDQTPLVDSQVLPSVLPCENQTLVVYAQDQALCSKTETGSNSVNTPETRREMRSGKRRASVEPNPETRRETRSGKRRASVEPNPESRRETGNSKSRVSVEPNPKTPETRRETGKRRASREPNPDSIGARLRQRRRSQIGL